MPVPHPFPYQGSKRAIASDILRYLPRDTARLIEPFCGSAAVSIAASAKRLASESWLNDLKEPLLRLWSAILDTPEEMSQGYSTLCIAQRPERKAFSYGARRQFNRSSRPDLLLNGKTRLTSVDIREVVRQTTERDTLYLDPPYQGTSYMRDHRYCQGMPFDELVETLSEMNRRDLSYILSYDGRTGNKTYGKPMPKELGLFQMTISAGRSTQATLLGERLETVESLCLSPALVERLGVGSLNAKEEPQWGQMELLPE